MALNNIMLFIDECVIRAPDLAAWRTGPALAGMPLVWEET